MSERMTIEQRAVALDKALDRFFLMRKLRQVFRVGSESASFDIRNKFGYEVSQLEELMRCEQYGHDHNTHTNTPTCHTDVGLTPEEHCPGCKRFRVFMKQYHRDRTRKNDALRRLRLEIERRRREGTL